MRRTSAITPLLAAAALAGGLGGVASGAGVAGSAANPVRATTSPTRGFAPATVVARPGARIHVRNVDRARHSVVEDRPGGGRPRFRSGAPTTRDFTVRGLQQKLMKLFLRPGRSLQQGNFIIGAAGRDRFCLCVLF